MKWDHNYLGKGFGKFCSDLLECVKHSWIHKRILMCDIIARYDVVQKKEYYDRIEWWTDYKASQLHEMGYRVCESMPGHDSLAWAGVPVMVRFYGFKTIEITDPDGSQDDPMFLNDRMESNLLNKFARSLARAATLAGMDLQKLILMAGIGIAAVVGMKMLGVF